MDTPNDTPFKTCTKCGKTFPATTEYFYKRKKGKYGLHAPCRECHRRDVHQYNQRYYYAHAKEIVVHHKERRQAHPEKAREKSRRYAAAHRDSINAGHRRRQRRYRESTRISTRNHRALKYGSIAQHTKKDVELQRKTQTNRNGELCCWWCGKTIKSGYHVDHVIPLSRGGSNAPENIVISCPRCNLSKSDKLPQEWNGRLL